MNLIHLGEKIYIVILLLLGSMGNCFDGSRACETAKVCSLPANPSCSEELDYLLEEIEDYRLQQFPETAVAVWAESSCAGTLAYREDEVWPAASLVKTIILLAAYIEFKNVWEEIPKELPAILNSEVGFTDPLEMLSYDTRVQVRDILWGMTYSELASSMMGGNQDLIGNAAYNSACNILIFLLGGDGGGCTKNIRVIHPDFESIVIGRYMLETRTQENENLSSMRSLTTACRLLASNSVKGLSVLDHQTISDCFQRYQFNDCDVYEKHGHLTSCPGVNGWIGWFEKEEGDISMYAVMVLDFTGTSIGDEGADYYKEMLMNRLYYLSNSP